MSMLKIRKTILPFSGKAKLPQVTQAYLDADTEVRRLCAYEPDLQHIGEAVKNREAHPLDRKRLVDALNRQYLDVELHVAVEQNISALGDGNTYTVTTAHQPCLCTGPLYVVYKILSAVKLAKKLCAQMPGKHFVPMFYIGSEDHDFNEINHFNIFGRQWEWEAEKGNAVGRMSTESLLPLMEHLKQSLGEGVHADELKHALSAAYMQNRKLAGATRIFLNHLFGKYGLVVLDGDDTDLKALFTGIVKEELTEQPTYSIVNDLLEQFSGRYKFPVRPRPLNLFYFKDCRRLRLERSGDTYKLHGSEENISAESLNELLERQTGRFSPNVILRTLYQESILPNVAYIGGPSEVAYWLELKGVFNHFDVHYPVLLLRNSVLWIDGDKAKKLKALHIRKEKLFSSSDEWVSMYMSGVAGDSMSFKDEKTGIYTLLDAMTDKAKEVDQTLLQSGMALKNRIKGEMEQFESRIGKAFRKNRVDEVERIKRIYNKLFPDGKLQERVDNFIPFYLRFGTAFFDTLLEHMEDTGGEMLLIEEE